MTAAAGFDLDVDLQPLPLDALGQIGRAPIGTARRRRSACTSAVSCCASSRASRSRSRTSRSMRPVWRSITSRNCRRCSGSTRLVHQRFDVAAHRGQRRAQLVRHVRHEIAAHAIGPAQIADVVQHEHGAAAVGARGRRLRAENPRAARRRSPRRAALRSAAAARLSARRRAGRRRRAGARPRRNGARADRSRDSACAARRRSPGAAARRRRRRARLRPCPTGWPPCARGRSRARSRRRVSCADLAASRASRARACGRA